MYKYISTIFSVTLKIQIAEECQGFQKDMCSKKYSIEQFLQNKLKKLIIFALHKCLKSSKCININVECIGNATRYEIRVSFSFKSKKLCNL